MGPAGHTLTFSFADVTMPWSSNCSTVDHLTFVEPSLDLDGHTTLTGDETALRHKSNLKFKKLYAQRQLVAVSRLLLLPPRSLSLRETKSP